MTDPVIHALSSRDAHLFDALPDPLDAREAHRRTQFRPDWKRVALRDGEVVARGAWWGGPDDSEPVNVNWFDVAEGEEEAGAELLRSAPWQVELEINLPGGWRDKPDLRAAAGARFAAARAAGYELLVERFLYRWTPERGLPQRPGRLRFSAEPDDTVFFDALRVKIRDEATVRSKAIYLALAVLPDGTRDILGLWIEQTEGAKFWMKVFTDLKTRGCRDILIAVTDGLKGMEEALAASEEPPSDLKGPKMKARRGTLRGGSVEIQISCPAREGSAARHCTW